MKSPKGEGAKAFRCKAECLRICPDRSNPRLALAAQRDRAGVAPVEAWDTWSTSVSLPDGVLLSILKLFDRNSGKK